MPKDHCSVTYKDLDYVIHASLKVLNGDIPEHNNSRHANQHVGD